MKFSHKMPNLSVFSMRVRPFYIEKMHFSGIINEHKQAVASVMELTGDVTQYESVDAGASQR